MKYHLLEHETYRETLKNREEIKNAYVRQEKALLDKKERLFRGKDLAKWGYLGEGGVPHLTSMHEKLLSCKEAAFTYMLQKETKELELQKEELSFYTN